MKKSTRRFIVFWGVGALFCVALCFSWAGSGLAGESCFECVSADQLEKMIVPEAELLDFSCSFQEWKGSKCLHFYVKLKNVSDTQQRFRVNIFLENGKAVGGLLPRKTKNGLIQAGEAVEFTYPVRGMFEKPEGLLLRIATMS